MLCVLQKLIGVDNNDAGPLTLSTSVRILDYTFFRLAGGCPRLVRRSRIIGRFAAPWCPGGAPRRNETAR